MTWLLTATGATFDLRLMDEAPIDILEIAHSLSMQCRFAGHTQRHYSVAEHSLFVVEIMERELAIHDPHALMAGLLHDAHEAYTGDLTRPMKQLIGDRWAAEEERIERRVRDHFGVLSAGLRWAGAIKRADTIALVTEHRDVMASACDPLAVPKHMAAVEWVNLGTRAGMEWQDWRQAFLDRFVELREGCRVMDKGAA